MARRPAPLLVLAAIALLIVGGVGWLFYQGTASGLLGRKGRLQQVTSLPVGADGVSELFDLTLRSSTGEVVRAELGDVRLDAEMAEQGGGAAQRHRHVPACLVRERR